MKRWNVEVDGFSEPTLNSGFLRVYFQLQSALYNYHFTFIKRSKFTRMDHIESTRRGHLVRAVGLLRIISNHISRFELIKVYVARNEGSDEARELTVVFCSAALK